MARGCLRHGVKERGAREGRGGAKQEPKDSHHGGGTDDEASEAEIERVRVQEATPTPRPSGAPDHAGRRGDQVGIQEGQGEHSPRSCTSSCGTSRAYC